MSTYIINIGSNLGDRRLNLSRAMAGVHREFGAFEMSHAVLSTPQGFDSPHEFMNVCMMFASEDAPEEVLTRLQEIERRISSTPHRHADGSYADRVLDIDIVAIDDRVIATDRLSVPHPRLAERRFFLAPLAEIAPGWRHPVSGLTAQEMLDALPDDPTFKTVTPVPGL